ncbi:alanine racemase [Chthonomonas calidirosea]|uniref:alanine racemase n=1 Tax=Chthonomonas calidirosea TaxID=454171 RepID=UPI0006ECC616|nr:alanine racemase [Chthonomonas calidirosea]CEK14287.1 predicted amino acid aldolase or racemase [Chthonomonas calidirosea]
MEKLNKNVVRKWQVKYHALDTPALLVDRDRLEANLHNMAELTRCHGKMLRPHAKTHKTPEIAQRQLAAGAVGLTVAKLGEAEVFAEAGCTDIFIANQIVGEQKLERLVRLARQCTLRVGVDSLEVAVPLSEAARRAGVRVGVRLEVDTGLHRAGVRTKEEAIALAHALAKLPNLELDGIFTYEGHLYQANSDQERAIAIARMSETLADLRESLVRQGFAISVTSVGSTPGARFTAPVPGLDELRCGVYIFNDRMQVARGAPKESCALTVLTTVISVRPDGRVIVDAGTKALASDKPFADQTMGEVLEDTSLRFVAASEEHGHLQAEGGTRLRVGDKVRIVPNHACTCVNLHERMYVVKGEEVEDVWEIRARGKFL